MIHTISATSILPARLNFPVNFIMDKIRKPIITAIKTEILSNKEPIER
jgi:hypothetical protein